MDSKLTNYLTQTLPESSTWILELEKEAEENHIPIMDQVSMQFLSQLIRIKKPKRILEIGTAIGYSALRMLDAYPGTKIDTIELDEIRYKQAMHHVKKYNKQDNIHIIYGDALDVLKDLSKQDMYDFIFIDAAKGQYKNFFELSESLLSPEGIILSDNILFRGYVVEPEKAPKRYRSLTKKLIEYNQWLVEHPNFDTSIVPIGDGVAISYKREEKRGGLRDAE